MKLNCGIGKLILFLVVLFSFSIIASAACETTIIYSGKCTPDGAVSVYKSSGALVAQENAGLYRGCYNGFYSIIIGTGGSGCDWLQGETVEFRINGNFAGRDTWNGDFTRNFNLATNTVPQCSDGLDNDNDGLIDYPNDPGCLSPTD